jgi:hypothetical protein
LKNIIRSIPHSHPIPSCPHADLYGARGRAWFLEQVLPEHQRLAVERHLREFDRLGEYRKSADIRSPVDDKRGRKGGRGA